MAQYNGYVTVPHGSYQEWRDATLGNGYNVDNAFGNQCWDFCALLWYQYGLSLITKPDGNGTAQDCWLVSRAANASQGSGTGHIAFADEDYNGSDSMKLLGQNQGQGSLAGSNIATVSLGRFLGAFRNTDWDDSPPTPYQGGIKAKKFPWPVAWNNWQGFIK